MGRKKLMIAEMMSLKKLVLFMIFTMLLTFSGLATTTSAETNLVPNPGFENGATSPLDWNFWKIDGNTPMWDTISHNGSRSILISIPGTIYSLSGMVSSKNINARPLQNYTFSAWVKTQNAFGSNAPIVQVTEEDIDTNWLRDTQLTIGNGTNDWSQKRIDFQTGPDTAYLHIAAKILNGYGTVWVDDVALSLNGATTSTQTTQDAHTQLAEATPLSLNGAPPSTPMPTTIPNKLEIGNWDSYGYLSFQDKPELTWAMTGKVSSMISDGRTTLWEELWAEGTWYKKNNPYPITNFTFIQSRFDLATTNRDQPWTYGTYLLLEEMFHPAMRAQWYPPSNTAHDEGLHTWDIEGSAEFAGVTVMQLKPWYIAKYGSWNQAWWDKVKSANKYDDPKIMDWSAYYSYNLLKAWNTHMHNIGKKSALTGLIGLTGGMKLFETWEFPCDSDGDCMWKYIVDNYDLIVTYQYPECVTGCSQPISKSVDEVKQLREKYNYRGKLAHILTSKFGEGDVGTDNENVQFEEFKGIAPYVDVIMGIPYADQNNPNIINQNPPRLIQFLNSITP